MQWISEMIWGHQETPEESFKRWNKTLKQQERENDREILSIQRAQMKTKAEIKKLLKSDHPQDAKILARELVRSNKTIERMKIAKIQLKSAQTTLRSQVTMVKMGKALGQSTEIMKSLNDMIKIPELYKMSMEMQREMFKAGYIEEMISETLDDMNEDVEEEANEEVEKVLEEILSPLKEASATHSLPVATQVNDSPVADKEGKGAILE